MIGRFDGRRHMGRAFAVRRSTGDIFMNNNQLQKTDYTGRETGGAADRRMPAVVDHAFTTKRSGAPVLLVPSRYPEAPESGCLQLWRREGKGYLVRFPSVDLQEITGLDVRVVDALLDHVKEITVVECNPAFFREDGENELVILHKYSALVVEHTRRRWWEIWE